MRHTKDRLDEAREVTDRYCRAHGLTQYTSEEVAAWAEVRRELVITRRERHQFLCELVSQANRADVIIDRRGRKARRRYAARMPVAVPQEDEDGNPFLDEEGNPLMEVVQRTFWSDIDVATDEFMRTALSQMADGIGKDIQSFFACLDLYNERLTERQQPTYQPRLPFQRPDDDVDESDGFAQAGD